jgi:peptide/nickel transport system permease protein
MRFSIRGSGTESREPSEPFDAHAPTDDELIAQEGLSPELTHVMPVDALAAEGGDIASSGSPWRLVGRTFAQNRLAIVGVGIVVFIILFSFVGPIFWKTNQVDPNLLAVNLPPGAGNPLGTDSSGFDILGRLMEGGQSSIEVGLAVGVISTGVGLIYGALSGYFGKGLDSVMMRFVDIGLAIPVVFLFIFMAQIFKPTLTLLIVLLAIVSWQIPARLVRGETLSLRTREYVQAVTVMGGRSWWTIVRHIIPNTIGTIMVTVTFQIANAILILAVLQFLGFGLPPTTPTWGSMLSDGTTDLASGYWWQVYPALVAIVLTVVAFNFIGDALQDAFDVRLQEK